MTTSLPDASRTRRPTVWESGHDPGGEVASLGVALVVTAVAVDLLLSPGLGGLFDAVFVLTAAWLALRVRPGDFFVAGVLPPLLMLAAVTLLAVVSPADLARDATSTPGRWSAAVTGLADHSLALLLACAAALGLLAVRHRFLARHPRRAGR